MASKLSELDRVYEKLKHFVESIVFIHENATKNCIKHTGTSDTSNILEKSLECTEVFDTKSKPVIGKRLGLSYLSINEARQNLVEAGYEIFRSFEYQFTQVTSHGSWETAIDKLAKDAVNRIVDFYEGNPEADFSSDTIILGVIRGKSRKEYSIEDMDLKTSHLFSDVGLTDREKYYGKKNGSSESRKYGYRLILKCDDLNEYQEEESPRFKYTYILKEEEYTHYIQRLLHDINELDPSKQQMRLKKLISEESDDNERIECDADIKKYMKMNEELREKNKQLLNDLEKAKNVEKKALDEDDLAQLKYIVNDNFDKLEKALISNQEEIRTCFRDIFKKFDNTIQETNVKLDDITQQNTKTNERLNNFEKQTNVKLDDVDETLQKNIDKIEEENEKLRERFQNLHRQNNKTNESFGELMEGMKKTVSRFSQIQKDKKQIGSQEKTIEKEIKTVSDIKEEKQVWSEEAKNKNLVPFWYHVPRQLLYFAGRQEQLQMIDQTLKQITVLVCGLDGMGKTELTIQYVHRYCDEKCFVLFIDSRNCRTAQKDFLSVYNRLGFKQRVDDGEKLTRYDRIIEEVYRCIGNKGLVIFDNVEDYSEIKSFVRLAQKYKPRILITSPKILDTDWLSEGVSSFRLTLDGFIDIEAKEFVRKYFNNEYIENDDIEILIKTLHNYPLALNQAVAYIRERIFDLERGDAHKVFQNFVNIFIENPKTFLHYEIDDYETTIFKILEMMLSKIKDDSDQGEQAIQMLKIISYLLPNDIPVSLFWKGLAEYNEEKLSNIIKLFETYSILKVNDGILSIHGLVQEAIRMKLKEEDEELLILGKTLDLLKKTLQMEIDREIFGNHIASAWRYACHHRKLIENFIVNDEKERCFTFLHVLSENGSYETVTTIIETIRDVCPDKLQKVINKQDQERTTPIHKAAASGNKEIVDLLIKYGANVNAKKKHEWRPLHLAAKNGFLDVVKVLLDHGANINAKTGYKYTPLHLASRNGEENIVEVLLDRGADVNAEANHNESPLHLAVKVNEVECVKVLLGTKDVNINAETQYKLTPLHFATKGGNLDIVRLLLKKHADVNVQNLDGFTSLHMAAAYNHPDIVGELLTVEGVDINLQTSKGNTPLHMAYENGNMEIVQLLLENKAKTDIVNVDGKLAEDLAPERIVK